VDTWYPLSGGVITRTVTRHWAKKENFIGNAATDEDAEDICRAHNAHFERTAKSQTNEVSADLIAAAPELARDNADLREQVAQLLRALEAMHEAEQLYFKARGKEDIAVALVHRVKADELAEKAILKAKGG
jgi:hypothetical protein